MERIGDERFDFDLFVVSSHFMMLSSFMIHTTDLVTAAATFR